MTALVDFREEEGSPPDEVLDRMNELYAEVKGKPHKVGDMDTVRGWWIETHTLGCLEAGGFVEREEQWSKLWEKFDRLRGDSDVLIGGSPLDGHFVVAYEFTE